GEGLHHIVVDAYHLGWKRVLAFDLTGQRFLGCGLGTDNQGFRLDLYGSPGDYLASGLDGAEVHVHANGQDQMAQIMKAGRLVVHGDLGQTFMYAAKGGEVYVKGNVAGRPPVNAGGEPRGGVNSNAPGYPPEALLGGGPPPRGGGG